CVRGNMAASGIDYW
nr:immunoglobulin heavy chain junction region [Macaca mulatta]MOY22877.1 immunoglobulin heavy chain junction region [Macaca mulatta]MOY26242.1 immunoglobulin heavy chain junction region [Macaca mulatta]MOY26812.1 immunoglobulin heavy chain junction region [Macaca mulatta]MOY27133.1 immunoglobulin heavy chain junction region [Macaca mulatta]